MIAVLVNCASVIAGSLVGLIFCKKINDSLSDIVCCGAGVVTMVIGFQMAFQYKSIVILALSVIMGGIIGSWLDIDGKILALGKFLETKFGKKEEQSGKQNFAYAFLNASVLFCVGAMAVLGSFNAGINKDYTLIFTKSILDGFMAIVFAAAMGIGTAFSAITVFVYQGLLTLCSTWIAPYVTEEMLTELSAVGGAAIVMIGMNLLKLRTIKTANYLPAIILAVVFVIIKNAFIPG
ncbi:MAG: DUF554 domain-containing protein [Spirochaetaceae bacterium]|nr:DUF554 domain-containing protein [Spirochaetaceae bacterium]